MTNKINFNIHQLLIKSSESATVYNAPKKNDFKDIEKSYSISIDDTFYDISTNIQDEYFWISADYGNTMPHRKTVVNVKDKTEKDNSRSEDEAELDRQIFFLYHFDSEYLYLSDIRKRNLFIDFFMNQFNREISIQSYYKTIEEIIKILKEVNEISFVCEKNLFSDNGDMGSALEDLTGSSSPYRFSLQTRYSKNFLPIDFMMKLSKEYNNCRLKYLTICGKDENNADMIYNPDKFREKISITLTKNDEGIFDASKVEEELMRKINL